MSGERAGPVGARKGIVVEKYQRRRGDERGGVEEEMVVALCVWVLLKGRVYICRSYCTVHTYLNLYGV